MAITNASFTNVKRTPLGASRYLVTGRFTGPASYTNGGEVITQAIANGVLGINQIDCMVFAPLISADGLLMGKIGFDHVVVGTSPGKIHLYEGTSAHAHDLLVTGGQGAGVALQIDVDSAAGVVGKTAATNRTLPGGQGTKNIQNAAVTGTQSELPGSSGALSGYVSAFFLIGS